MSEQLVFDLPHRPALDADDFLVSDCNAVAVRLIDSWPDWPNRLHVLVGPRGAGKTHLANVWRLRSRALVLEASNLAAVEPERLARAGAALLEDMDRGEAPETELFHLLNLCGEHRISVLMTAAVPPMAWPIALPDLASRLRAVPIVTIGAPDDTLLKVVLLKQFADRQLDVEPSLIAFLATRMDRSMAAARALVGELDRVSLAQNRRITRQLAGEVLARLERTGERDG